MGDSATSTWLGWRKADYSAVQPPSSTSAEPVISEDASEARNTIAPVSSPSWPSLILPSTSSRNALFSKNGQEGRPERVDADIVRGELDRHRLGEALHGVLGGPIDGAARGADVAYLRGDVDDRSGFASTSRSVTVCAMKKAARTLSAKMASKSSTFTTRRNVRGEPKSDGI